MNLFSCFTCQRMEKKSNDGFKEGNSSNNGSQVFQWFQEPFAVARQISFGSLNDALNRPKIFPESHLHVVHRPVNVRIHHRSHHHSYSRSEQSYRVSPSFPPPHDAKEPEDNEEEYVYPVQKNDAHMMDDFLREFNQDMEFIDNISREIMKAKRAIDEEIYQELQRRRP